MSAKIPDMKYFREMSLAFAAAAAELDFDVKNIPPFPAWIPGNITMDSSAVVEGTILNFIPGNNVAGTGFGVTSFDEEVTKVMPLNNGQVPEDRLMGVIAHGVVVPHASFVPGDVLAARSVLAGLSHCRQELAIQGRLRAASQPAALGGLLGETGSRDAIGEVATEFARGGLEDGGQLCWLDRPHIVPPLGRLNYRMIIRAAATINLAAANDPQLRGGVLAFVASRSGVSI